MAENKILLEVWRVWNYSSLAFLFIWLPALIFLWNLNYKIGFWILLIAGLITQIGTGVRISKLENKLLK